MDEYIEREEAIEIAMQYCPDDDGVCSKADADLREMLDEIEAIPAADVAPVRHGRWEYDEEAGEYCCSECHRATYDSHDEIKEFEGGKVIALCLPRYCGYCGARMDGGQDDGTT